MQTALILTTTVQPGGKVEVSNPQIPSGNSAKIIALFPQEADIERRAVIDVLAEALGHLAFQTAKEVASYIQEERDAWGYRRC
ncbi:MAG: hypothetical protein ACRYFS_04520 [Janthinobacterium lividum]